MDQVFWVLPTVDTIYAKRGRGALAGGGALKAAVESNEVEEEYGGDEGVWQDDDSDDDDDDVNNEGTAEEEGPSTRIDCEGSACRGDDDGEASCLSRRCSAPGGADRSR